MPPSRLYIYNTIQCNLGKLIDSQETRKLKLVAHSGRPYVWCKVYVLAFMKYARYSTISPAAPVARQLLVPAGQHR